jgi:alpha-glucosidase (family GH31 glycosyl hydrolase)
VNRLKNITVSFLLLINIFHFYSEGLKAQEVQSSDQSGKVIWTSKANGVWMITSGQPEKFNLTSSLELTPKYDAINSMTSAPLPINQDEIKFEQHDGKTYIRFPLDKSEKIFGLGLNFKSVEQRGRILRLHVDHYGNSDNGRTHAPVPFFVSSKGYGAFINSARYLDVYVGTGVRRDSKNPPKVYDRTRDKEWTAQPYSDNLEILVPAQGVELVLFSGVNMLDVVRRFNLYNGGGCLPPKWGLGFWHRVPLKFSDKDVNNEVAEFKKNKFPLSVLGLEPGWMSGCYPCTYEWDKTRFPNPQAFVNGLLEQNIRTNVWMNPGISPRSEVYPKIEAYTGSHTEWCGAIADLSLPEAKNVIADHLRKHIINLGVSGFKLDENDGYDNWIWPDIATFPSGVPAEQMRQVYGSLQQNMITGIYKKDNVRTYGLARAANAGSISNPFVLYNDYYDHRDFITALINSSFIGVLWTPEVRASKTSEEWLRRMQTVCFSPLAMLNAWSDGTKPWSFADVADDVKAVANQRLQLIPYLYTAFADYAFYGTPPMRAMNLEEGYNTEATVDEGKLDGTQNPYALALVKEVKDQFMVGENLLIAPLFTGETSRKVILPKGKWYDFYTGNLVGEGEVITVSPGMSHIPVFVKDGGIVPMFSQNEISIESKQPLEIRQYGQKASTYSLYDDDGKSYNYEKGDYTRIQVQVTLDKKGGKTGKIVVPKGKQVWSFSDFKFRFMTE